MCKDRIRLLVVTYANRKGTATSIEHGGEVVRPFRNGNRKCVGPGSGATNICSYVLAAIKIPLTARRIGIEDDVIGLSNRKKARQEKNFDAMHHHRTYKLESMVENPESNVKK